VPVGAVLRADVVGARLLAAFPPAGVVEPAVEEDGRGAAGATAAATPLGAAAANLYQLYVDSGGGALDFSGIMEFLSRAEPGK